jgi:tol-pal system protein YbgF
MIKRLIVSGALLLLVGCSSKTAVEQSSFPEYDFSSLEKRVIRTEDKSEKASENIEVLTSKVLRNSNEVIQIDARVSQVSPARLEELEIQLALLTEAFRDLHSQLAAIKVLPQIKYAPKAPKKPTGFTVSNSSKLLGGDEFAVYSRGLESYRKRFYTESIQFMRTLLEKFPKGEMRDRAQFWIGEALFQQRSYDEAIKEYEVVASYPQSTKLDDASYKIALAYYNLGENDVARERLKYLMGRYPASEYVTEAKQMLEKLSLDKSKSIIKPKTEASSLTDSTNKQF